MLFRSGPYPGGHFSQDVVDLEIAFCQASLGRIEIALDAASLVHATALDSLDVDDRLVASWMAMGMATIDSRFGSIDQARRQLDLVSEEYEAHLGALRREFAEFADK